MANVFLLFSFLLFSLFSGLVVPSTFTLVNECGYTIWPAILSNSNAAIAQLSTTGFVLNSGESFNVSVAAPWSGRVWARTLCSYNGKFTCLAGDCGSGTVECPGGGAAPHVTLAEFTLNGAGGLDSCNVSLVDGYLPMLVAPQGGDKCGITPVSTVDTGDKGGDIGGQIGNDGDYRGDGDIGGHLVACWSGCKFTCAAPNFLINFCQTRSIGGTGEGPTVAPLVASGGDKTHNSRTVLIIIFAAMLMAWQFR